MQNIEKFELGLKYLGIIELVECLKTDHCFIMDMAGYVEHQTKAKSIRSASYNSKDKSVTIKYDDGKTVVMKDSLDPKRVGESYGLSMTPLYPDIAFDGATISDDAYWKLFRGNYAKAIFYQFNQMTSNKKKAKEWYDNALRSFDKRIMQQRGIDPSLPLEITIKDRQLMDGINSYMSHQLTNRSSL